MWRWNACVGQPLLVGELLYRAQHGLIDERLHSRMGAETTNGDGFGVGWYGIRDRAIPARYRSVSPAWNGSEPVHHQPVDDQAVVRHPANLGRRARGRLAPSG